MVYFNRIPPPVRQLGFVYIKTECNKVLGIEISHCEIDDISCEDEEVFIISNEEINHGVKVDIEEEWFQ